MKSLIMINGTMGVGKSETSRELQKILTHSVFLDGDWCWYMRPFVVTDETKGMVMDNIAHLLNSFIGCSAIENIIFCWVMHEQSILDEVLSRLNTSECRVSVFTLIADEAQLKKRIANDITDGIRMPDSTERSIERMAGYQDMNTEKIDVSNISAKQAAQIIKDKLLEQ